MSQHTGSEQARPALSPSHAAPRTRHRALFLGYGRIGQAVAAAAARERHRLRAAGVDVHPVRALVRDLSKPRRGPAVPLVDRADDALDGDLDVVVEALGGIEPARTLVEAALRAGVPVVSANKTLVAAHGPELRALAARHETTFACDAAVLAGVPFLGALARRPLVSAARRIEGILNGTSHAIVTALSTGASFTEALADAIDRGYAEPDSSADISGRDAAEKLTILLHLAGCEDVRPHHLPALGLDALDDHDVSAAASVGGTIKPVAIASLEPDALGAWVGPAFVAGEHPFARLSGVTNTLRLSSAAGTCTFSGPGAGPEATAVTIVDDIVEAVSAGPARPIERSRSETARAHDALRQPPPGSWFVRVAQASHVEAADLAEFLAVHRVPAVRLETDRDRIVVLTAPAAWPAISSVADALRAGGARVLVLPVLSGGRGE